MIIGLYNNHPAITLLCLKIFSALGQTKYITCSNSLKDIIDEEGFIEDVEILQTELSPDELFVRDNMIFNEDFVLYEIKDYVPPRLEGMVVLKGDEELDEDIMDMLKDVPDKIVFEKVNEIKFTDLILRKLGCQVTEASLQSYLEECTMESKLCNVKDKLLQKALVNGFSKFLGLKDKCIHKLIETEV